MERLSHPIIEHIERTGYPYGMGENNVVLGECEACGDDIYSEYCGDALKTDDGMFCCRECCDKYYGIRSLDQ